MPNRMLLLAFFLLGLLSVASLELIGTSLVLPSWIRDPLYSFVQPGTTVWWLILGGPFQTFPHSAPGIALAVLANAGLWSLALWVLVAFIRAMLRRIVRSKA